MVREQVIELSYEQAAERLGCTPEWLARVETGFESPSPAEVERILTRYGCREAKAANVLIDMASRPAGPSWLAAYVDRLPAAERDILTMESEASVVRAYGFRRIPSLLQIEPFARLLLPHIRIGSDGSTSMPSGTCCAVARSTARAPGTGSFT